MKQSDFGKGLSYCIGLFLAHEKYYAYKKVHEKINEKIGENLHTANMWFNGASDHLYELEIPDNFSNYLKGRLKKFKTKCLDWGHGITNNASEDDFNWAIQEAKDLLRLIDKHNGIKVIKGDWE